jgi:hypothetical protein
MSLFSHLGQETLWISCEIEMSQETSIMTSLWP